MSLLVAYDVVERVKFDPRDCCEVRRKIYVVCDANQSWKGIDFHPTGKGQT